jgi:hypothetical protein
MELFEGLDFEKRMSDIKTYKSKAEQIYYTLKNEQNMSADIRYAYEKICQHYIYKFEREIHNLWFAMCGNNENICKKINRNPNEPVPDGY